MFLRQRYESCDLLGHIWTHGRHDFPQKTSGLRDHWPGWVSWSWHKPDTVAFCRILSHRAAPLPVGMHQVEVQDAEVVAARGTLKTQKSTRILCMLLCYAMQCYAMLWLCIWLVAHRKGSLFESLSWCHGLHWLHCLATQNSFPPLKSAPHLGESTGFWCDRFGRNSKLSQTALMRRQEIRLNQVAKKMTRETYKGEVRASCPETVFSSPGGPGVGLVRWMMWHSLWSWLLREF
jgi:hypothetical protein